MRDYLPQIKNIDEERIELLETIAEQIIHNAINEKNFSKNHESQIYMCPVYNHINTKQPILSEKCLEGYFPIDLNLYGMQIEDDYFYFKVVDEGMNLKVHKGDYALIHSQDCAENGDIVLAIIDITDEVIMKKYKKINDEIIILESMSTYPIEPIIINLKESEFKIIGKAIGQFGKF